MLVSTMLLSCGGTSEEQLIGEWKRRSGFIRAGRSHTATFVIGNKGYVCCGYIGTKAQRFDVFEFDHTASYGNGRWTEVASFPGTPRQQAVGFSIGQYGYVGTGWDGDEKTMKDFWRFDPANNEWVQVASLPGKDDFTKRRGAIAFSLFVNGKEYGFVGYGFTDVPEKNYLNEVWQFDPDGETIEVVVVEGEGGEEEESVTLPGEWTLIDSQGGGKRLGGVAFVIGNKAYICNGENPTLINDFWAFDPDGAAKGGEMWKPLRTMNNVNPHEDYDDDYGALGRSFGVAFVAPVNGQLRGHVVGGRQGAASTCWEYDHDNDIWHQRTSFFNNATRQNREGMVAFSFPNAGRAFAGMGKWGANAYEDDMWEFFPLIDDNIYDDYQ